MDQVSARREIIAAITPATRLVEPNRADGKYPSQKSAHTAAPRCVASLIVGDNPFVSSSHPTTATAVPPPTRTTATATGTQPAAPAAGAYRNIVTVAMPSPPPRGVGAECELLSLGMSRIRVPLRNGA